MSCIVPKPDIYDFYEKLDTAISYIFMLKCSGKTLQYAPKPDISNRNQVLNYVKFFSIIRHILLSECSKTRQKIIPKSDIYIYIE